MKFLSKKNIFLANIILFIFAIIFASDYNQGVVCELSRSCYDFMGAISYVFLGLVFLVFPVLLLTLPFRPSVFESWRAFAIWAVPITLTPSILLVLFGGSGNAYMGDMGFGALLLFIPYVLYFLVSLTIIAVTAWRTRESRQAM